MKTKSVGSAFTIISLITFIIGCTSFGGNNPITPASTPSPASINISNTETPTIMTSPVVDTATALVINSASPCVGASAPAQWKHVVVLMFENHDTVIGSSSLPYISALANKCGTFDNWNDADFKVDGTSDGEYNSKPNYATLTNGLSPTAHGILTDKYQSQTSAISIYDQLNQSGKTFKDYYDAEPGGCSVEFNGAYHDPIRYYTSMASICDQHDVPLSNFMDDVNNGSLPDFSMIIPSNDHNMHDNSLESGDAWAKTFLEPLLNSAAYQKGDMAVFFLWDEDSPVPNVLIAPSIVSNSNVPVPNGNPISHFSALRTWEEMLGLPLLGDTNQAPSLLTFFGKP